MNVKLGHYPLPMGLPPAPIRYKNFGDNLDNLIYRHFTGEDLPKHNPYLICGSVMKRAGGKIVWGAGIGHDHVCKKPKRICAVRGKLTRNRVLELGFDCPEVYGDPALLLPLIQNPRPPKKYKIGFIPHKSDTRQPDWAFLIHPERNSPEQYIKKVNQCEVIVSTSLHGGIVADAYGIPTCYSAFNDPKLVKGNYFKYRDYLSVIDEEFRPVELTETDVLRNARVRPKPDLKKLLDARPF